MPKRPLTNKDGEVRPLTADRKCHVLVTCANDAEIVAVVPDGRGQGPSLETKAFDKAAAYIAIASVSLQHADFQ
jgi:hypothetical protein